MDLAITAKLKSPQIMYSRISSFLAWSDAQQVKAIQFQDFIMLDHLHMVGFWSDSCSLEYDHVVSRGDDIHFHFAFNGTMHAVTLHLCVACNEVLLCY